MITKKSTTMMECTQCRETCNACVWLTSCVRMGKQRQHQQNWKTPSPTAVGFTTHMARVIVCVCVCRPTHENYFHSQMQNEKFLVLFGFFCASPLLQSSLCSALWLCIDSKPKEWDSPSNSYPIYRTAACAFTCLSEHANRRRKEKKKRPSSPCNVRWNTIL